MTTAEWLTDTLVGNLIVAFKVCDDRAKALRVDKFALRDRVAFMLETESGGGYIYGNDGRGYREPNSPADRTPWNYDFDAGEPRGTPQTRAAMRELLSRSVDPTWLAANGVHFDRIGNNGRSTGPAQQISSDVGGGWGPMQGTMDMATSVGLFCDRLVISDSNVYSNVENGRRYQVVLESAIARDVLTVQQPLRAEAESSNYALARVIRAQTVARDDRFTFDTENPVEPMDFLEEIMSEKYVHIRFTIGGGTQACVWHVLEGTWSKIPDEGGTNAGWYEMLQKVLGDSVARWENLNGGNPELNPALLGREIPFNLPDATLVLAKGGTLPGGDRLNDEYTLIENALRVHA